MQAVPADLVTIILGGLMLSALHALIPNHWLPVLAISRKENWSLSETTFVTFISGGAHVVSTVLIGVVIGYAGLKLADSFSGFTTIFAPTALILLGIFYIYQHHRHKHFSVDAEKPSTKKQILITLTVAMFFSPCFEIEAYFLMAGAHGWTYILMLSILYIVITLAGMIAWIRIAYKGLVRLNWHSLEHNAGIITGTTLIITGIISYFIH
jgi:nickel/cobalt transporter (NicO) family protein